MLHGSPHPGVAGSELTRLLARFAGGSPHPVGPAFAERLGHWLSWSDAISLSAALNAECAGAGFERSVSCARALGVEEADFQRVRAALAASIAAGSREDVSSPTDFGPHRRHCAALQQAMHDAVGALRQRLRDALAGESPGLARLAAIDAVMDRSFAARERSLLGLVPQRLHAHFEQLQRANPDDAGWLQGFRHDMHLVLLAELEHRLLSARGLLGALHTHRTST